MYKVEKLEQYPFFALGSHNPDIVTKGQISLELSYLEEVNNSPENDCFLKVNISLK